jgi:5'-deoxynucleotidase YfbR-like HD superfamily hydrolase
LVCKKSYGKEKGNDHYKNHPTCADGAKEALRLFLNPPVKKVRIKKEVETVDTKEVETLKKQILKLEKEIKRADDNCASVLDDSEKYLKYLQKLFGSDNEQYIMDYIDDLESLDRFKSYKDLLEEKNFKGE